MMTREFTGRHMLAVMVIGFGIVIGVNVTMAHYATSTFGGVVVENSYVASQKFNTWLDEAARENKLGWSVDTARGTDGRIAVATRGIPAGAQVIAIARHPLGRLPDREFRFVSAGPDSYVSTAPLEVGRWTLRLEIVSGKDRWRGERSVR